MNAQWEMELINRFVATAGIENFESDQAMQKWDLMELLRKEDKLRFDVLNEFLNYAETYELRKKDQTTLQRNADEYTLQMQRAEKEYHRALNRMAFYCSNNKIEIRDMFDNLKIDTLKFKKGDLVIYKILTGIFNINATRLDPFGTQYPDEGFDYIIQRIDITEQPTYHVKEDNLTLRQ